LHKEAKGFAPRPPSKVSGVKPNNGYLNNWIRAAYNQKKL